MNCSGFGAHWTFLSDAGRKIQKDLGIAEYTDPLYNPMIPHVIVLEPRLVVCVRKPECKRAADLVCPNLPGHTQDASQDGRLA